MLWANPNGFAIFALLVVALLLTPGCGGRKTTPAKNPPEKAPVNQAAGAAEEDFEKLHNRAIGLMGRYQYGGKRPNNC
jgi:hypothetical protein